MAKSFILTIQNDPEDEIIQIILEGVRNVLLGHGGDRPLPSKLGGQKLAHSFILNIQINPEDKKIQIILEGVRNVILEDMEKTADFIISYEADFSYAT